MVTSRSFSMSHMAPESPLGLGSSCCPLPLNSTRLSCIIPELLNWAPFYFLGGLLLHILLKILLKRKSSHGILQCHSCGFLTKGAPRGEGFFPLWFLKDSCPPWQGSMAEAAQLVAAAGGGGSLTFQLTSKLRKTDQNLQRPAPSDLLPPFRLLLPNYPSDSSEGSIYSLQNSATSWGLCEQDAILWGTISVSNYDDWGILINSVQICNKIQTSSLHLGLLRVTWPCFLFGLSLHSLRAAQVFIKLVLIYLLLLLSPHFSMFN